ELGSAMQDFDEMVRRVSAAQSSLESQIQKRTESLQRSAAEMRAVFEATGEGILTFNDQGKIQMANSEAETMWAYENAGLIGLSVGTLMGDGDEAIPGTWLKHYLKGGANIGVRTELVGRKGDGSAFPVEMQISETRSGDGRLFTACARDISDRK